MEATALRSHPALLPIIAILLVLVIATPRKLLAVLEDVASFATSIVSALGIFSLSLAYGTFLLTLISGFLATKHLLLSSSEHGHVPILLGGILIANVSLFFFGADSGELTTEVAQVEVGDEEGEEPITTNTEDVRALISAAVATETGELELAHGLAIAEMGRTHSKILKDMKASHEVSIRTAQKSRRQELGEIGEKAVESEGRILEFLHRIAELEAQIEGQKKASDERSERLPADELTTSRLTKENMELKAEVTAYENTCEQYSEQMISLSDEKEALEAQSAVDEKSIAALQDLIVKADAATERSALNTQKLERQVRSLKQDVEALEDKVADLEDKIDDLDAEIDEKDEDLEEGKKQIAGKSAEIADMEEVLAERSKSIAEMAEELDAQIDELAARRVEIDELKGDAWNLKDQATRHAAQLEEKDKVIEALTEDLAKVRAERAGEDSLGIAASPDDDENSADDDEDSEDAGSEDAGSKNDDAGPSDDEDAGSEDGKEAASDVGEDAASDDSGDAASDDSEDAGSDDDDDAGSGDKKAAAPENDQADAGSNEEADSESDDEDAGKDTTDHTEGDVTDASNALLTAAESAGDSSNPEDAEEGTSEAGQAILDLLAEAGIIVDEEEGSASDSEPSEEPTLSEDQIEIPAAFATTMVMESELLPNEPTTVLFPKTSSYPPAPETAPTLSVSRRINYLKKPGSAAAHVTVTSADMEARSRIPADRLEETVDAYTGRDEFTGYVNEVTAVYGAPDPLQTDRLWSKCPYLGHRHPVAECSYCGGRVMRTRPVTGATVGRERMHVKLPTKR